MISLCLRPEGVPRGELAELLWGAGKLNNLRHALHAARRLPGAEEWLQDRDPPRLNVRTDLAEFESASHEGHYERALKLWRGPLLDRLEVPGATAFMEMIEVERSRVRGLYLDVLLSRATELEQGGQYETALGVVDELLKHDNLSETAYRAAMRLERRLGNLDGVLARYEACRRALYEELGVEPLEETRALLAEVEAEMASLRATGGASKPHSAPTPPPMPLPTPRSKLVGRRNELASTGRLLKNPARRLVSLTGPGGVGKTRLALAAAEKLDDAFVHGVHFVPLAPVSSARLIPTAIAHALGFTFAGDTNVERQLTDYLKDRQALLVIDNLEHLLEGADALLELLEACPGLKLLITSREAIGIRQETRVSVEGLASPLTGDEKPEKYDAFKLFVERAKQAAPDFVVDEGNRTAIAKIVTLLEGLPLGIELAAAVVNRLLPTEIAAEIETNLDTLQRHSPELPSRHRSLGAVFEHSWSLLSDREREVLAKLTVFRGGCDGEAARAVTGATLRALLSLVDKSLLRRGEAGRFQMHEAVRQFAAGKLADVQAAHAAHGTYYADLLREREPDLTGRNRSRALAEVATELDNVRAAWGWAVKNRRTAELSRSMETLYGYHDTKALSAEAFESFAAAAAAVTDEAVRARLLVRQAVFANRLVRFDQAERLLAEALGLLESGQVDLPAEEALAHCALGAVAFKLDDTERTHAHFNRALALYQSVGDARGEATAWDGLGTAAYAQGDYREAERLYKRCLDIATELDDVYWLVRGLKNVGLVNAVLGRYEEAADFMQRGVAAARSADDRFALAGSLNNLGKVQQLLGDLAESEKSFEECLELHRDSGNAWGRALVSSNLGTLHHQRGALGDAKALLLESLASFEEIEYLSGVALALARLGYLALDEGDVDAAKRYFGRGLRLASSNAKAPVTVDHVMGHALIEAQAGDAANATSLLVLVAMHAAAEHDLVKAAEKRLRDLQAALPTEVFAEAHARGKALELLDAVNDLLGDAVQ